jgi:hypothetical protein
MSLNPFSRFLGQWSRNRPFTEFVARWDDLEVIVVRVYRQKMTPDAARPTFEQVWPWLRQHYPAWEAALRPYWQQTNAGGRPTQTDPFQLLLAFDQPEAILDNWTAMQHLPAAREAINKYLLRET